MPKSNLIIVMPVIPKPRGSGRDPVMSYKCQMKFSLWNFMILPVRQLSALGVACEGKSVNNED